MNSCKLCVLAKAEEIFNNSCIELIKSVLTNGAAKCSFPSCISFYHNAVGYDSQAPSAMGL